MCRKKLFLMDCVHHSSKRNSKLSQLDLQKPKDDPTTHSKVFESRLQTIPSFACQSWDGGRGSWETASEVCVVDAEDL